MLTLRRIGDDQPLLSNVIQGHPRTVVGYDNPAWGKVEVDDTSASIEGILDELEDSNIMVRDQLSA